MSSAEAVTFDEYVAARAAALLRFCHVLTGHPQQAEDLLQAALTDAYVHWRKVVRADDPEAYVRRVIVNRYLAARRRRWWGETPTPDLDLEAQPDHAQGVADRDALRGALAGLTPRQRAVIVLRYLEDLDDAAIANVLDMSLGNVRVVAHRALAALRGRLEPGMCTSSKGGATP